MPVEASLWIKTQFFLIRTQPSLTLKIWQNSEPGQNPWKYKKSLEMSKSKIKKGLWKSPCLALTLPSFKQ